MAKRYRIKWRLQDRKTLARTVKNFNAKITRLEKKHPELKEFLPEKISVKDLKNNIETRQDFNRELKSLRFSSTERLRYGLSLPGSFNVPLYSRISSADRSQTYAFPFLIKETAASYI